MIRRKEDEKKRLEAEALARRISVLEEAISTPGLKPIAAWEAESRILDRINQLQISSNENCASTPAGIDPRTNPALARKKRQILLRQAQREHQQRVFDLDESLRNLVLYAPRSTRKLVHIFPSKTILSALRKSTPAERPPDVWTCARTLPMEQVVEEARSKNAHRHDEEIEFDEEGNEITKKVDRKRKRADDDDGATTKRRKGNAGGNVSTQAGTKAQQQAAQKKGSRAGYANEETISSAEMETQLWRTMRGQGAAAAILSYRAGDPIAFHERIYGDVFDRCGTTTIKSPWSGKLLKPYIRRDDITNAYQIAEEEAPDGPTRKRVPLRVRMHQELLLRRNLLLDPDYRLPHQSIDYCYLRPEYLEQVNRLLCEVFWPGIDISESLVYPEHTIVVMVRKLVVGCGFIAPNGYITYICLHPEWQKSGIGSFILYHLIQTCPGKDVTLHVSATNPAMLLYQKFCFKVEEFIKNFYDKYLPDDSSQCKHAYFLRLRH